MTKQEEETTRKTLEKMREFYAEVLEQVIVEGKQAGDKMDISALRCETEIVLDLSTILELLDEWREIDEEEL